MGSVTVNMAAAAETIPEGIYLLNIVDCEQKPSNSSDHDYLNWSLVVADGEKAGFRIFEMTSLSPKAAFRLNGFLRAAGVDVPTEGPEAENFTFDPQDLFGVQVAAEVYTDTYNDRQSSKVRRFYPAEQLLEAKAKLEERQSSNRRR